MTHYFRSAILLVTLLSAQANSHATVIVSNLNPIGDTAVEVDNLSAQFQSFVTGSNTYSLTLVTVNLDLGQNFTTSKYSVPTVSLLADSNGLPDFSPLASLQLASSLPNSGIGAISFAPSASVDLTPGRTYWLELSMPPDEVPGSGWILQNTAAVKAGFGSALLGASLTGSANPIFSTDSAVRSIEVSGALLPVPELPIVSYLMLGLLAIGLRTGTSVRTSD